MRSQLERHRVFAFATLTLLLSFAAFLLPLPTDLKPILLPILIVFVPTLVATAIAATIGGTAAVGELYATLRPGNARWLALAVLIGGTMQFAIALLAFALGIAPGIALTTSTTVLALAIFTPLFALGEEIGWRGFALRELLRTHPPLRATLLTGVPWAAVHLVLFLPDQMFVGRPLVAQVAPIVFFAVVHGWIFIRSGGSVLGPTLLHGTFNALGAVINSSLSVEAATYLGAIVLVASAAIILAIDERLWFGPARTPIVRSAS